MPDRTCIACARPIAVGRRRDATTCGQACYAWARRHPGVPKPLGTQQYTCEHCGEGFARPKLHAGKTPRFCGDVCWEAWRHRQRPFGEWRKAEPFKPRPFTCVDCGLDGEDSGRGPRATRCESCRKAYEVEKIGAWVRANPDRRRKIARDWARNNPEKVRAALERSRESRLARQRQYRLENAAQVRVWGRDRQARRRARQAATTVEIFPSEEIYVRDGWVCGLCRRPVDPARRRPDPMSPSLDHIVPLSRGGAHVRSNVQLAHLSCNVKKGASLI